MAGVHSVLECIHGRLRCFLTEFRAVVTATSARLVVESTSTVVVGGTVTAGWKALVAINQGDEVVTFDGAALNPGSSVSYDHTHYASVGLAKVYTFDGLGSAPSLVLVELR